MSAEMDNALMYEQRMIERPAVDQKTRADHIAWLRALIRTYPRGPLRRDARRRRRDVIRAFDREHLANRPRSKDIRIAVFTAPFGVAAGSLIFWVITR